jgi:hypothetical protein
MLIIYLAFTLLISVATALPQLTARVNINGALQKALHRNALTDEGLKAVIAKASHSPLTRSVNIGQLNNIVKSTGPKLLVKGVSIKQDS